MRRLAAYRFDLAPAPAIPYAGNTAYQAIAPVLKMRAMAAQVQHEAGFTDFSAYAKTSKAGFTRFLS